MQYKEWRAEFERLVNAPRIELAHAALLIATDEYPDLNVSGYLERLDLVAAVDGTHDVPGGEAGRAAPEPDVSLVRKGSIAARKNALSDHAALWRLLCLSSY